MFKLIRIDRSKLPMRLDFLECQVKNRRCSYVTNQISKPFSDVFLFSFICLKTNLAHNTMCSFCDDTCIDSYLQCRICVRVYHCKCLYVRGYMSASFTMPRTRKQNWTCPECVSEDDFSCSISFSMRHFSARFDSYSQ